MQQANECNNDYAAITESPSQPPQAALQARQSQYPHQWILLFRLLLTEPGQCH